MAGSSSSVVRTTPLLGGANINFLSGAGAAAAPVAGAWRRPRSIEGGDEEGEGDVEVSTSPGGRGEARRDVYDLLKA